MPKFMLDRDVLVPPGYAERSCLLVKYRLPFLRHCFVMCHEPTSSGIALSRNDLLEFFLEEAERLALELTHDHQAYMLLHSGASVRRRANWHLHVFVVQHRWQKAWVYCVLGAKNLGLAVYAALRAPIADRQWSADQSKTPCHGKSGEEPHFKRLE